MTKPYVRIILPTYNIANQWTRAIYSVLNQTYENFELIIVDDASKDDTESIVSQIYDPRIRYIKNQYNCGAAGARNVGIKNARYDFIAFQDSDDEWMPEKLAKQMKVMKETDNTIGVVYSEYYYHSVDGTYDGIGPDREIREKNKSGNVFPFLLLENLVATPTILARKEVFDTCGMYKEDWKCLEDYEWILRVSKKYSLLFINDVLLHVHANRNCVSNNMEAYFHGRCDLYKMYQKEIENFELKEIILADIMERAKLTGNVELVEKLLGIDR